MGDLDGKMPEGLMGSVIKIMVNTLVLAPLTIFLCSCHQGGQYADKLRLLEVAGNSPDNARAILGASVKEESFQGWKKAWFNRPGLNPLVLSYKAKSDGTVGRAFIEAFTNRSSRESFDVLGLDFTQWHQVQTSGDRDCFECGPYQLVFDTFRGAIRTTLIKKQPESKPQAGPLKDEFKYLAAVGVPLKAAMESLGKPSSNSDDGNSWNYANYDRKPFFSWLTVRTRLHKASPDLTAIRAQCASMSAQEIFEKLGLDITQFAKKPIQDNELDTGTQNFSSGPYTISLNPYTNGNKGFDIYILKKS